MSNAYYDNVVTTEQAKGVLTKAGAKHSPERSKPGIKVYKLKSGGEAMAEAAGTGKIRLRLFVGKCAC